MTKLGTATAAIAALPVARSSQVPGLAAPSRARASPTPMLRARARPPSSSETGSFCRTTSRAVWPGTLSLGRSRVTRAPMVRRYC